MRGKKKKGNCLCVLYHRLEDREHESLRHNQFAQFDGAWKSQIFRAGEKSIGNPEVHLAGKAHLIVELH
jgi:hypothetical protein